MINYRYTIGDTVKWGTVDWVKVRPCVNDDGFKISTDEWYVSGWDYKRHAVCVVQHLRDGGLLDLPGWPSSCEHGFASLWAFFQAIQSPDQSDLSQEQYATILDRILQST